MKTIEEINAAFEMICTPAIYWVGDAQKRRARLDDDAAIIRDALAELARLRGVEERVLRLSLGDLNYLCSAFHLDRRNAGPTYARVRDELRRLLRAYEDAALAPPAPAEAQEASIEGDWVNAHGERLRLILRPEYWDADLEVWREYTDYDGETDFRAAIARGDLVPAPKPKEEGPPVACHKCSEGFEVFTAGSIFPGTCARCGAAVGFGEGPLIPERTAKAMRELRAAEAEEERR